MNSPEVINIEVVGGASGKVIANLVWTESQNLSLLDLLQKHHLPIASSCGGEGQCQKCLVNFKIKSTDQELISCLTSFLEVSEFLKNNGLSGQKCQIFVSYL